MIKFRKKCKPLSKSDLKYRTKYEFRLIIRWRQFLCHAFLQRNTKCDFWCFAFHEMIEFSKWFHANVFHTVLTWSTSRTLSFSTNKLQWCRLHLDDGIGISICDERPTRFSPGCSGNVRWSCFLATSDTATRRQLIFGDITLLIKHLICVVAHKTYVNIAPLYRWQLKFNSSNEFQTQRIGCTFYSCCSHWNTRNNYRLTDEVFVFCHVVQFA